MVISSKYFYRNQTFKKNIAFGIDDLMINDRTVEKVTEDAQLKSVLDNLSMGMDTILGEGGNKLSGGQRQRVGITRALYSDPQILVMDEATSSLDNTTEKLFLDTIEKMRGEKTLIIVAHRLSTIKNCDYIFFLEMDQLAQ